MFLSYRPSPSLDDIDAKRLVQTKFARLGQTLERHGQRYIAINVFEKKKGGYLHGHSRLHIANENFKDLEKLAGWCEWRDGDKPDGVHVAVHVRVSVESDAGYITKEHRWPGPDAVKRRYWQDSEAIRGKRISWTKAARLIITQAEAFCAPLKENPEFLLAHIREGKPYCPPIKRQSEFPLSATREEFSDAVSRAKPTSLFDKLPTMAAPSRSREPVKRPKIAARREGWMLLPMEYPPDALELLRHLDGRPYAERGARLGLSRQQMNNAAVGRFGLGRDAVKRIPELAKAA